MPLGLRISSVTNMAGASVAFRFNPSVIQVTDAAGNPLSMVFGNSGECFSHASGGSFIAENTVNNTTGVVTYAEAVLMDPAVTGSCTLASMYVKAVGNGTTVLSYTHVELGNVEGNPIPFALLNGFVTGVPATPTPSVTPTPTATPTPVPGRVLGQVSSVQGRLDPSGVSVSTGGMTVTTASSGAFTLTNVPPGTYTVTVSMPGYLFSRRTSVPVSSSTTTVLPPVSLTAGDLKFDGNNRVDLFDLILLGGNWQRTAPTAW